MSATRRILLFLALSFTLIVAGCRREETSTDTTATTAVVDETITAAQTGVVEADTSAGTTVLVLIEDNTIGLPTTDIPPGPASFTVTNSGQQVHDLVIEGRDGVAVELEGTLEPGQSRTMSVDLKPGTYQIYCPILDHRNTGQQVELVIPR